ncbi:sufb sufd domain-containing protein [Cyclospora cayetanensis]|uniref:Sufb sufd domain-containing protein n=1 Tax=Cyclospora cayetanensis TaxID=88456 RepID=A0A1D3CWN7_9EIME|nr:sufb sufd domain-containing protein [Cyclospora cayetanensis]
MGSRPQLRLQRLLALLLLFVTLHCPQKASCRQLKHGSTASRSRVCRRRSTAAAFLTDRGLEGASRGFFSGSSRKASPPERGLGQSPLLPTENRKESAYETPSKAPSFARKKHAQVQTAESSSLRARSRRRTAPPAEGATIDPPTCETSAKSPSVTGCTAAADALAVIASEEEDAADSPVLQNEGSVRWLPQSLASFQVPPATLQQLRSDAAAVTNAAITPWSAIAASRFVDIATDTFVPQAAASSAAAVTAAREAAWSAAQRRCTAQDIAEAARAAAEAAQASGSFKDASEGDLWGDVGRMLRSLIEEEEEGNGSSQASRKQGSGSADAAMTPRRKQHKRTPEEEAATTEDEEIDISVEPRFIPETWTDVPRPFLNSTVISTLSASHLSKPDIDTTHTHLRNRLHLQFVSPLEKRRQAFWLQSLGVAVRSLETRAAAAASWLRRRHREQQYRQYKTDWRLQQEAQDSASKGDMGSAAETEAEPEAPPFPLPASLTNINHRFYNAFKLMNTAGWNACVDLPTPHSRLESWRLGSDLRRLYFSRFDARVSLRRKLLPEHLKDYVLPHADAVLVMRDGVVDPTLSRGSAFLSTELADQEEVGGVAASSLEGMESKNPHEKVKHHNGEQKGDCGCGDTQAKGANTPLAPASSKQEAGEDQGEEEPEKAVCCSFFDLNDASVRSEIERQLRFIPEYSNYWRTNTQAFHRGQIGKTSRKYDNDFAIYDYRKLDFGMAKLSALNLAGMQDAGVVIITDCDAPASASPPSDSEEETVLQGGGGTEVGIRGGEGATTASEKESPDNCSSQRPLVLQVIHVTTTDEIDAIGVDSKGSSDEASRPPKPATPLINPRFVIHVGRNAKCQVHQTHVSFSSLLSQQEQRELRELKQKREKAQNHGEQPKGFRGPFVNSATRVVVEEGGEVHHVYAQELDGNTAHFENLSVCCHPRAKYKISLVDVGAAVSRFALQVEGSEASSHISRGISLLNNDQDHAKFEMLHHIEKDAETDQVHKSLVAGKARAIWRGRIRIERKATGASASSLNRVILLEDGARCVAVPTLEIIPEDIKKATHGAAIRDFDTEPLFYMMSRGLPALESKRLLMLAFVDDVVGPLRDKGLSKRVRQKVLNLLPQDQAARISRHHMFRGGDGGG